jgi:hypothetical protein
LQPTSSDPEILDAQKRNKVITHKDLIDNAEAKGYLTKDEINAPTKDAIKLQ